MFATIVDVIEAIRPLLRPVIVAIILLGLWMGLTRARFDARTRIVTWLAVAIPMIVWFFVINVLVQSNAFKYDPGTRIPALPLAVMIPVAIGLVTLMRSNRIATVLDAIPHSWLIGIQVVRVLGGIFVVRWAQGSLPGAFALPAGIGDALVGALALPVAFYVSSGARGRAAAVAWNIFGITDLVTALTMGALTSPSPIQMLAFDQPNPLSGDPTLVMIPVFFVPMFLIVHCLSLRQLRRGAAAASELHLPAAKAVP